VATTTTIITRALRLLGQIESGEDAGDDELSDGLIALNAMLDSWRNERLMCYALQEESLTLADGDAVYTIGPSGDLNTSRPVAIEAAWIVDSDGATHDVEIITDADYAGIANKTTEGDWPDRAVYRPTMSTGTLVVYPVPNATRTLKLLTRVVIASLSSGDSITLPPGWERALAFNLAIEIAPEYETAPSMEVMKIARESKAAIKRINTPLVPVANETAAAFNASRGNILTGE
jgi:hypothetical protein